MVFVVVALAAAAAAAAGEIEANTSNKIAKHTRAVYTISFVSPFSHIFRVYSLSLLHHQRRICTPRLYYTLNRYAQLSLLPLVCMVVVVCATHSIP